MGSTTSKKARSKKGMGRISEHKKYAQVLVKKDEYEKMEKQADLCGFPSFSAWANFVLLREVKEPKHVEP